MSATGYEMGSYIVRLKSGEVNPQICRGLAAAQRQVARIGEAFVECLLRWDAPAGRWMRA